MKKRFLFLLCILIVGSVFSQDLSTFQKRQYWLLSNLHDVQLKESEGGCHGKHVLVKACARLWNNPEDTVAINYITKALNHPGQTMFDFPGIALSLGMFWDSFSPAQLDTIQTYLEVCAKPDKTGKEGFLGHGTENHANMMWASAYLFGQWFPNAKWKNGMTSTELMSTTKEWMRKTFKNVYEKGYTEYMSSTYEVVNDIPVMILYKYARDPEMKAIAEAFLLYKWSVWALHNFEGHIIAPYTRMNTMQDFRPDNPYVSAAPYVNWLYWGWGPNTQNVKFEDFINYWETSVAIYNALLSDVGPNQVFNQIASGKNVPFEFKTSAPTFGTYGTGVPHMMLNSFYRTDLYAIGTGNFRWVPGGDYADHDINSFNIVWHSADRFNYIECTHPYWNSDGDDPGRAPDSWLHGNISPFQQTAQYKNTAIVLYDIPEKDPWPGKPSKAKWEWRDAHSDNLIKRGMFRYPKSTDEKVEVNGWIFLREGEVYIGVKPLKDYYIQTDLKGGGMDGFNVVKSDFAKCGFVFEVGTEKEFGSFEKFRDQLLKNKVSVDWGKMAVSYTNSLKDKLQVQYQPGLPVVKADRVPEHWQRLGITGMAESIPVVTINGQQEKPWQDWPLISSPFINMDNSILKIDNELTKIIVDWRTELPVIQRNH
jgi:hypothetical protein